MNTTADATTERETDPADEGSAADASVDAATDGASASAAGGSYDVIRRRLVAAGEALEARARALNEARTSEFGSSDMRVLARTRVRTEHNGVGRDIVQVGELLLFGYNVLIGLKAETRVEDVLSLHRLVGEGAERDIESVPVAGSFLDDTRFRADFDELHRYYRDARLVQLVQRDGKLLVAFRIGERLDDLRVFRWRVPAGGGTPDYVDNRGERDLARPPTHDFEWTETGRDDIVNGRHPHVNVRDRLFVETTGGTLTVRVEDNTEGGRAIWSEPVDEPTQSLGDAAFAWAEVGELLLLRVLPYRESVHRYLVFNPRDESITRVDAIGDACQSLPEDHGIIFPDGIHLVTGERKSFGTGVDGLRFKRRVRSPNGEDVLYVFYEPDRGLFALLSYNLITRTLQNPILTHGWALADDGTVVVFTADDEPTRVHAMQIWSTSYTSDEHAAATPAGQGFLARVGNGDLVRGVSDLLDIARLVRDDSVSAAHYERLHREAARLPDEHYWLADPETGGVGEALADVAAAADLIVDEFEKVESIRRHSAEAMRGAEKAQEDIRTDAEAGTTDGVDAFVDLLTRIRRQRGHIATIGEYRYIDTDALGRMDEELVRLNESVGERTADFLSGDDAFAAYRSAMNEIETRLDAHESTGELAPDLAALDGIADGLDLLSELVATLAIADPNVQTRVIEQVSDVYAELNRVRAVTRRHRERMGSLEAAGQFAAQMQLLAQSVTNALGLANTPEDSDEQATRLLVQLEELEGRYGEHERFLGDILARREEIHDTFAAHRQRLVDARQARARTLQDASTRMLDSIERRTERFAEPDELNAYLASDALVLKVRDVVAELRELGSAVGADEAEARLTMIRDVALRGLRDKSDLFEGGGRQIRLGAHRFGVNTEALDLGIVPRGDALALHLVGTRYHEPVESEAALALRPYWNLPLESETDAVYRAEYLAWWIVETARTAGTPDARGGTEARAGEPAEPDADDGSGNGAGAGAAGHAIGDGGGADNGGDDALDWPTLVRTLHDDGVLERHVRRVAAERYREGYRKGVHDADAVAIVRALVPLVERGDLLRFDPASRALAQLVWANIAPPARVEAGARVAAERSTAPDPNLGESGGANGGTSDGSDGALASVVSRARSAATLQDVLGDARAVRLIETELGRHVDAFVTAHGIDAAPVVRADAARYLAAELGRDDVAFVASREVEALEERLARTLDDGATDALDRALDDLAGRPGERLALASAWFDALLDRTNGRAGGEANGEAHREADGDRLRRYVPEAAVRRLVAGRLTHRRLDIDVSVAMTGLLGEHPRVVDGALALTLDAFLARLGEHARTVVPGHRAWSALRQSITDEARDALRIDELRARPLSSFVRNRLVDEAYLPIVGDNLAKQIGTVGEGRRSDLNGLLMMISPPGYGKTTLMEYVASRLGLAFVKVNGPALGHETTSLDPATAPDAPARQELEKLNLALEMGDNVMLLIDDIQHTHPAFLQKFISLCDATRRIEGVWKGRTRTHDLRGRRFCVVMAGNPYTESGESFRVPDMLANRADVYNLGDVLSGREQVFELSYIENALSSNATLAPLATRDLGDVHKLVDLALGRDVATTSLSHAYGGAEIAEIVRVLQHLFRLRDVVLAVNREYIASAAQDDRYRTEPRFQLQGSYRNMNRLAEKVSAAMNEAELEALIDDHYRGEAQLLTQGAESNLLKLAELRGTLKGDAAERWQEILEDFRREQAMGGDASDAGQRIARTLSGLAEGVGQIGERLTPNAAVDAARVHTSAMTRLVSQSVERLEEAVRAQETRVAITNTPSPEFAATLATLNDTIEHTLFPLVRSMDNRIGQDLDALAELKRLSETVERLEARLAEPLHEGST